MMFRDKIVVVTGGASGIGKALVEAFVRQGAVVAVVDLRGSQAVVQSLQEPARHMAFTCDVTNEAQVQTMIAQIKQRHGKIDIYCSNAGILFPPDLTNDSVTKCSIAQWSKILQVNLLGHVTALRDLLPDWERGMGEGHFCITASAAGLLTMIGDASYGVSKAAAVSLAEHLAISHPAVKVHCLCPQAVDTPFIKGTSSDSNAAMSDGIVSAEYVADCTLSAILRHDFFIFPHTEVPEYVQRKAKDHARWLKGMQKLRQRMILKPQTSKL
jgi:NAD(P)-dependent dehydrogenase (short-subunit alcohol dehydrogenase family)